MELRHHPEYILFTDDTAALSFKPDEAKTVANMRKIIRHAENKLRFHQEILSQVKEIK